jgi:hypothetical protein
VAGVLKNWWVPFMTTADSPRQNFFPFIFHNKMWLQSLSFFPSTAPDPATIFFFFSKSKIKANEIKQI